MNYSFEYIDIILLAMIAGFIFLRLRGILGKKTGHEENTRATFSHGFSTKKEEYQKIDGNNFDEKAKAVFLKGAKIAYESIVTSFSSGELKKIKTLLDKKVFNEFNRVDKRMSRYREDSELSEVNRIAASKSILVSSELLTVLEKAQQVSRVSGGAFDMTFSSVGYLYDLRASVQPDQKAIRESLPAINYQNVLLDPTARTVGFKEKGVLIDLGGIAKGYAVDQGIAILKQAGIKHARLSAGGDMYLLGDKRGKPWVVGIKDPRPAENDTRNTKEDTASEFVVALPLADVALSTSGDYERFFIDGAGQRIHHILSPKTGKPAKGIQSVSVIGPDTTTTDGLSTAIFVLGVKEGLALIERLAGIDVIIIDDQHRFHYSTGLMQPAKN